MNSNNTVLVGLAMLVIGFLGGYGMWGMNGHTMSNGKMMSNSEMSMGDMMDQMNATLSGKTGDQFDQAFIDEMVVHHQGAVGMAKLALTNAKHQEIKDLAQAIITAQDKEIQMMSGWKSAWYSK